MSSVSKWRTLIYQTKKKITRGWLKFVNQNPNQKDVRYQDNNIGKNVRLGETTLQGKCAISDNVYLKGDVTIGKYSTIGQECFLYGGKIRIGNYCQLGPRVAIYSINHPTDHITTYVNKNLFDGNLKKFASDEPVEIGNDVWIGYGAILLPGVKVGNGAIVGAGAVVTHNIETYGVAVGNPAKVVKTRFETDIISLLNDWKWWELNPDELNQYQELFCENISNKPEILRNYLKDFAK